ncbi:unnamed protein product [Nesidiocoris tenuis]|uniref:Uncharacterized protein n=1 Tax=Nesidiocoris tenuis TaxID=355587 RepID=A0A6H5HMJ2_9HEMI|nr:unnamed protein product [Nesidiocoris tenuis]
MFSTDNHFFFVFISHLNRRSLPFSTISIGKPTNYTVDPDLEIWLRTAARKRRTARRQSARNAGSRTKYRDYEFGEFFIGIRLKHELGGATAGTEPNRMCPKLFLQVSFDSSKNTKPVRRRLGESAKPCIVKTKNFRGETGGMEQESLSDFEEKESPENSRPASRAVSRKRSKSTTPFDEETVNAAKTVLADACKRRNQRTTCSAFGELVAQKLADYDPRTRSQVEMKVMQVLHEADMQMYDTPTTSFSQCNVTVTSGEYSGGDVDKLEQPQATEEMTAIRDILAEAFQVVDEE